jgi:FkbM family methyltransferase
MMRKFADLLLKKCVAFDIVNFALLNSIDLQKIRHFLGKDFLSPIQQFALDGYNSLLYKNLDIDESGVVVVLGGYLGDSASNYSEILGCEVNVYEPIGEFYRVLLSRFSGNDNINIFNYAIASTDGKIQLSIDGEKTGFFNNSKDTVEVEAIDICGIIEKFQTVDLLESNIEGGEYLILIKLIETGRISSIKILQIQFHNYGILNEFQRSKIRLDLLKTHNLIFSYDWVWERWELR